MPTVRESMTDDVTAVDVGLSLRETLEVLRSENVSGAPVVTGTTVGGVVSATDILEFAATSPGVPTSRSNNSEWGEFEAPERWKEGDDPATYFAGYWSDAGADLTARFDEADSPEWDLLSDRTVADVMSRKVVSVSSDTEIHEAAQLMLDASVHRVLVIDDGELVGIFSSTDVVQAVAQQKDLVGD